MLRSSVTKIHVLVIFYDEENAPLDVSEIKYPSDTLRAVGFICSAPTVTDRKECENKYTLDWEAEHAIRAGLATRVDGKVHVSVQPLTKRIDIHVLDFKVLE